MQIEFACISSKCNNQGGGGTPSLSVSRYAPRFCPPFSASGRSFCPPNLTMSTISFRSCWVPYRKPPFSGCWWSFCTPNWPDLSFYPDLGPILNFEWRTPTDFYLEPGPPPKPLLRVRPWNNGMQCIPAMCLSIKYMIGVIVWSFVQGEADSFYTSQRPSKRNRQT